jgi:hypothetical protein
MRGRVSWLLVAALMLAVTAAATAATAQPLPCTSVSPEAREYVRQRGACRDVKPPRPRASTKTKSKVSPSPAPQEFSIPDVIGRSDADAARALANFKVERIETASAAPAGEVLAQEPASAALGRSGSTVILRVSDGSLATAASMEPVTAPDTAAGASSTTAPATDPAPASTAVPMLPQEPAVPPGTRDQLPTALSASAALIFGAGMLLGLVSGALLMRTRLLRRQLAAGEVAPPPMLTPIQQPAEQRPIEQQPVDQQPVDQQRVDEQPVDEQPVDEQPVDEQPVDEQPVDKLPIDVQPVDEQSIDERPVDERPVDEQPIDEQPIDEQPVNERPVNEQPAKSEAGVVPQPGALSEFRFASRFVPGETTIVFAPFQRSEDVSIEDSIDHHA